MEPRQKIPRRTKAPRLRARRQPSKDNHMTAEAGPQPSRNLAWTETKMDLVGSGCEKAKHHLNPSPKRPKALRNRKQKAGETLPTEPSKDKKKIASSTTNLQAAGKTCPKTSWAFTKPASSSKHPNVTFGSSRSQNERAVCKRPTRCQKEPLERLTTRKRPPLGPSKDSHRQTTQLGQQNHGSTAKNPQKDQGPETASSSSAAL